MMQLDRMRAHAGTLKALQLVLLVAAAAAIDLELTPVHVRFLTDCTMYSDWQSVGVIFSFRMSGQPGTVGRVMCCSEEEKKKYDVTLLKEVTTWVAPSMSVHPKTGDHYAAYNKPEAVIDWLDHETPEEDYVLVLDSDMIIRKPFLVEDMRPSKGSAVGARYTYMIGVANELADRHIPEIAKRNDTRAGPFGRRADQVGGFFFVHKDDLKRMSHNWLKYTEDVRADDQAYRLSGDVYAIHPGDKPWISEMYGYAFGAAKANVWHDWDSDSMIYPQYEPRAVPKLMHYGLLFEVGKFKFDKHWHYDFDVTKCPPWDLKGGRATAGIFPAPPRPSDLKNKASPGAYFRDLLSIDTAATLNAAFCDYHLRHCSPSQQLYDVCSEALDLYQEVQDELSITEQVFTCRDWEAQCREWARAGECKSNPVFMEANCALSCKTCSTLTTKVARRLPTEALASLKKIKAHLATAGGVQSQTGGQEQGQAGGGGSGDKAEQQLAAGVLQPVIPGETLAHRRARKQKGHAPKTDTSDGSEADDEAGHSPEASPPPSPKPPPPPSPMPPPSPLPPSPNPPSPSPPASPSAQQLQLALLEAQARIAIATNKPPPQEGGRQDYLLLCQRQSLTVEEMKECLGLAKQGVLYKRPSVQALLTATADSQKRKLSTDSEEVAKVDVEDLSLTLPHGRKASAPASVSFIAGAWHRLTSFLGSLSTFQAVIVWLLVLVLGMLAWPYIQQLRRKARSGLRSE